MIELNPKSLGEIHSDHKWGYEVWIVNEPEYCAKLLVLENNESSSKHYHKNKKETFIVLSGKVRLNVLDDNFGWDSDVLVGSDKITIIQGQAHSFQALEVPSVILEVSTFHEDSDTYRV